MFSVRFCSDWSPIVLAMDTTDIHATARSWFAAKEHNGTIPQQMLGGSLDGLHYYEVVIDEETYWLTQHGLFTPLTDLCQNDPLL